MSSKMTFENEKDINNLFETLKREHQQQHQQQISSSQQQQNDSPLDSAFQRQPLMPSSTLDSFLQFESNYPAGYMSNSNTPTNSNNMDLDVPYKSGTYNNVYPDPQSEIQPQIQAQQQMHQLRQQQQSSQQQPQQPQQPLQYSIKPQPFQQQIQQQMQQQMQQLQAPLLSHVAEIRSNNNKPSTLSPSIHNISPNLSTPSSQTFSYNPLMQNPSSIDSTPSIKISPFSTSSNDYMMNQSSANASDFPYFDMKVNANLMNSMNSIIQDSSNQYLDFFNTIVDNSTNQQQTQQQQPPQSQSNTVSSIYSNNTNSDVTNQISMSPISKTGTIDTPTSLMFNSNVNSGNLMPKTNNQKYFSNNALMDNNNNSNSNTITGNTQQRSNTINNSFGPEIKIEDTDLFNITPNQLSDSISNLIPLPNAKSEHYDENEHTPQFYRNLTPSLGVRSLSSTDNDHVPLLTVPTLDNKSILSSSSTGSNSSSSHEKMRLGRQNLHSTIKSKKSRSSSVSSRSRSASRTRLKIDTGRSHNYHSDLSASEWENSPTLSPGGIPISIKHAHEDQYPHSDIGDDEDNEDNENDLDDGEERKYICDICGKDFTRPYNLKSHLRTHTNERPYACRQCGKRFARQHDRKRHEDLHSGEKRFQCKGTLSKEIDINGKAKEWGCNKRFARTDALRRHFWTDNGKECIRPFVIECIGEGIGEDWDNQGVKLAMENAIALMKANEPAIKNDEKSVKNKPKRGRPKKEH